MIWVSMSMTPDGGLGQKVVGTRVYMLRDIMQNGNSGWTLTVRQP